MVSEMFIRGRYDSLLSSTIVFFFKQKTAYGITGSMSVAQNMQALYEARLREAKGVDAMEGYPEQPQANEYIEIRY